jgi:hypothetical protein
MIWCEAHLGHAIEQFVHYYRFIHHTTSQREGAATIAASDTEIYFLVAPCFVQIYVWNHSSQISAIEFHLWIW